MFDGALDSAERLGDAQRHSSASAITQVAQVMRAASEAGISGAVVDHDAAAVIPDSGRFPRVALIA